MIRWLPLSMLLVSCVTTQPSEEPSEGSLFPGTDSVCERLTQASDEPPYAQFFRCRIEGQVCIVLQSYDPAGGLSLDCEDDEG